MSWETCCNHGWLYFQAGKFYALFLWFIGKINCRYNFLVIKIDIFRDVYPVKAQHHCLYRYIICLTKSMIHISRDVLRIFPTAVGRSEGDRGVEALRLYRMKCLGDTLHRQRANKWNEKQNSKLVLGWHLSRK